MKDVVVVLPWAEYHNLQVCSAHIIEAHEADEWLNDSHLNECYRLPEKDALALMDAFHAMSLAAWTPNQDVYDQEINGQIIADATAKMGEILKRAQAVY